MISDFTRSNCLRDAPDEHFVWENGFKMSNNAFCKQSCINPARSLLSMLNIIAHGYTACMSRLAFKLVAQFVCETKATKRRASSHAILAAERVSFVAVHKSCADKIICSAFSKERKKTNNIFLFNIIPEKNEEEERNAFFFLSVTVLFTRTTIIVNCPNRVCKTELVALENCKKHYWKSNSEEEL
ncbi:hypothetical protein T02_5935 [Trichinella nativa]|uniref:Uncharacterized protein n=1 Tax=Trichinella nativa TaxID=6335 RepID=A0A0V1LB50_9BILA|nr:hypothetical protein T02_5935 [Trichinella nativa]